MPLSPPKLLTFLVLAAGAAISGEAFEYSLDGAELENRISLRVLKFGNLDSRPIKLGSRVQVKIKSFSPDLKTDLSGEVVQTFEVGKHNITPLNEALLDMRVGEIRRLGVPISIHGKIFYEFALLSVYAEHELWAMEVDLQELQKSSVLDMLQLASDEDLDAHSKKTWKTLIYDEEAMRILSPILKLGELRRQGVTLNLLLKDKRDPIPGVDAVYLVTPTEENVAVILADAREPKYSRIHINFTTFTSDGYLSELARRFVETNAFNLVASVADRYLHFVTLSPTTFSLNMPLSFKTFYGDATEAAADAMFEQLADRLLSLVVTTGSLPFIRAPRAASPASTVAERLSKKLYDLVSTRTQLGISLASSYNRPLMVVLDRSIDLGTMIQHSWNYQPLLHDLFGIDYNKVSLRSGQARKDFDLETGDKIYQSILGMPLSEVAMYISSSLDYYNTQIAQINKGDDSSSSLVNAINAIPQLKEQKRLLDMHTNIATSLVDAVREREIDRFYEFEYDLDIMYDKNCLQSFEELLDSPNAKPMDKYRSLLIMALSKTSISDEKLNEYEERIKRNSGIKCESLKGLRSIMKMKDFSSNLLKHIQSAVATEKRPEPAAQPKNEPSQTHKKLANYSSKLIGTGYNLFKGVRNLLPRKKNLHVVKIVENLITNLEGLSEDFVLYDPKTSEGLAARPGKRPSAKKCLVFVVGGASYNEALAMSELAARLKYTIVYGSTFFDRPEDFVVQLGSSSFLV